MDSFEIIPIPWQELALHLESQDSSLYPSWLYLKANDAGCILTLHANQSLAPPSISAPSYPLHGSISWYPTRIRRCSIYGFPIKDPFHLQHLL